MGFILAGASGNLLLTNALSTDALTNLSIYLGGFDERKTIAFVIPWALKPNLTPTRASQLRIRVRGWGCLVGVCFDVGCFY